MIAADENPPAPPSALRHALLLTRPYSWLDAALNVLLGYAWVAGDARVTNLGNHALAAVVGICLWFSLNWISERIQRDPGRTPVSWPIALTPLVVAASIAFALGGAAIILPGVVIVALLFVYPMKARSPLIGPFGPFIRGLHTSMIVALGCAMAGRLDGCLYLIVALGLCQVSRSLIGDMRDHATDKYELPRIVGIERAKQIALLILVVALISLGLAEAHWLILAVFAAQICVVLAVSSTQGYLLHMFMVLASVVIKAGIYWQITGLGVGSFAIMLALQLGLLGTYSLVPRPSNRDLIAWLKQFVNPPASS
jgi:hypothetical protein